MHLNSAALSNYLFWNVSLCQATKGVWFREKIATAAAIGLHADESGPASSAEISRHLPQEMLPTPGPVPAGCDLPGAPKNYYQMSKSFSG